MTHLDRFVSEVGTTGLVYHVHAVTGEIKPVSLEAHNLLLPFLPPFILVRGTKIDAEILSAQILQRS